MNCEIVPRTA